MSGNLNHSPADVLRYLLVSLGYGTLPESDAAWPIYVYSEPDTPDNCITLYDTTGRTQGRTQIDGETQEHEGIQIRIRSMLRLTGFLKASEVILSLDTEVLRNSVTIDASSYLVQAVSRTGNPLHLGRDRPSSNRTLHTINVIIALTMV